MLQGRPAHDVVKETAKEGCLAPIQLIFFMKKRYFLLALLSGLGIE